MFSLLVFADCRCRSLLARFIKTAVFNSPKFAVEGRQDCGLAITASLTDDGAGAVWIDAIHSAAIVEHPKQAGPANHHADVIEFALFADLLPLERRRFSPIEISILDGP